jgi:hypothetical protein
MRAKMVSKDVATRENGAKVQVALKYYLSCPIIRIQRKRS